LPRQFYVKAKLGERTRNKDNNMQYVISLIPAQAEERLLQITTIIINIIHIGLTSKVMQFMNSLFFN